MRGGEGRWLRVFLLVFAAVRLVVVVDSASVSQSVPVGTERVEVGSKS